MGCTHGLVSKRTGFCVQEADGVAVMAGDHERHCRVGHERRDSATTFFRRFYYNLTRLHVNNEDRAVDVADDKLGSIGAQKLGATE